MIVTLTVDTDLILLNCSTHGYCCTGCVNRVESKLLNCSARTVGGYILSLIDTKRKIEEERSRLNYASPISFDTIDYDGLGGR